mgnify:CR=1 FL=1
MCTHMQQIANLFHNLIEFLLKAFRVLKQSLTFIEFKGKTSMFRQLRSKYIIYMLLTNNLDFK